jgi:hypothetical protein
VKKCRKCGQDVYVTPKGKELSLCAVHALEALALLLYPRKAKAIKNKPSHPRPYGEELRRDFDKS